MKTIPTGLHDILACPKCKSSVTLTDAEAICTSCAQTVALFENGVWACGRIGRSYFDSRFETMEDSYSNAAVQEIFYRRQSHCVQQIIGPGSVVLDVGCGARMRYASRPDATIIGLDPSFASVAQNTAGIRICASAAEMPIQDSSIDLIVCFYSLHHMVGLDHKGCSEQVLHAFTEFGRILRPRGNILVFEVTLPAPLYLIEMVSWKFFRSALGSRMDMHFYSISALREIALRATRGTMVGLKITRFSSSPFRFFPPILSIPRFRIPRLLSPLSPIALHLQRE